MGRILGSNWINGKKLSGINAWNSLHYKGDTHFGSPYPSKGFLQSMITRANKVMSESKSEVDHAGVLQ